jgi:hypothetical protein
LRLISIQTNGSCDNKLSIIIETYTVSNLLIETEKSEIAGSECYNLTYCVYFRNFGPGPPISPVPDVVFQSVKGQDVQCKVDVRMTNDGVIRCILTIGPSAWSGELINVVSSSMKRILPQKINLTALI